MKYRRATIVADDWHGEFGSYDHGRGLDPNPLTGLLPLLMLKGDVASLSMILLGRDDRAFPVRYRWETTKPRKHA